MRAVDRAFDYLVPDTSESAIAVGTIVRVPLHGRRVRGWVMGIDVEPEAEPGTLLPIQAVVSAGPPPDVPVRVAKATVQTMPVQMIAIGNVEAFASVSIKPLVSGELETIRFEEG